MEENNLVQQPEENNQMPQPVEAETQQQPVAETTQTTPAEQPAAEPVVPEQPVAETSEETPQPADETPEDAPRPEAEVDYTTMTREELMAAFEQLMTEEVQQIKGRAQAIRTRFAELDSQLQQQALDEFVAAGGEKETFQPASDDLSVRFHRMYDDYRKRRQQYIEQLEIQKQKNLEAKMALIDELRSLVDSEEEQVRVTMDRFNDIQERWKQIGEVPREKMNDLWQNYHFQIEQFFSKLKINRELRALDQKRNLEQKITLCEKAEELIVEPSVTKAFKGLQDLRAQWKEIGPVPADQNEEIWQRFQSAALRIDERRKEFYEQRHAEQQNNLLAKQALVEKAAELTAQQPQSVREWNDLTASLDELLKVWKTIGPVPREVNEEIWTRFKGMIDKHYADKKNYFATMRDEQDTNYQRKVELCLKAEAIAQREDWKQATEELLQLQQEWKSVGPVSRKASEKIWQRFRAACDAFFAKKGEYFSSRRAGESENLAAKQAILSQLKEHVFGDNREENLQVIKEFQRRWAEVGHVPIAEKDRLQKEFRSVIDGIFERLKISAREAEATAYRERVHSMGGDARRFIRDERQDLTDKIEKLRADLALWENNLGFLASSKQADLLKQEFEKKMQNARQQISLLQAKLRILNETETVEEKKDAE